VAGGWPCQDISVAGLQRGLAGEKSGLFFELLRIASESRAHTLLAENVPNLLVMEKGETFRAVLGSLGQGCRQFNGPAFPFISWRTLNARQFGLPHSRVRVFIIASFHREIAMALHRPLPAIATPDSCPGAAGFYWTAGIQSLCYSEGYVPTLKVGSSLSIPSPPAIHFADIVRKATPDECLLFQGFVPSDFVGISAKDIYRMTGNAVAAPVGRWVFGALEAGANHQVQFASKQTHLFGTGGQEARLPEHGFWERGDMQAVVHAPTPLCSSLGAVIDTGNRTMLSARAAGGLLFRLRRSGKPCPPPLAQLLADCAGPLARVSAELADDPDFNPSSARVQDEEPQMHLF
jgi:DNA (cytosine-5)-methyltransferase 1